MTGMTLVDHQMEFDTVDHYMLLKKQKQLVSQIMLLIVQNQAFQISCLERIQKLVIQVLQILNMVSHMGQFWDLECFLYPVSHIV